MIWPSTAQALAERNQYSLGCPRGRRFGSGLSNGTGYAASSKDRCDKDEPHLGKSSVVVERVSMKCGRAGDLKHLFMSRINEGPICL